MGRQGQSLIQVLVSIAIMSVGMLVFTTMTENQQRELSQLSQKLAASDLEKMLIASLADGSVCQYVTNHPSKLTFNAKSLPATITLPSPPTLYTNILAGPTPGLVAAQANTLASPLSSTLKISDINLIVLSGSSGNYKGVFNVVFDSSTTIRALNALRIAQTLVVDDSNQAAASITACQSTTTPPLTAPIGTIVAWYPALSGTPSIVGTGWVLCDGSVLNDPLSPFNGKIIPNLNSGVEASTNYGYFLRGAGTAGLHEAQGTAVNGLSITGAGYKLIAAFSWLGYHSGGWGGAQYGPPWSGQIISSDKETHPPSVTVNWIMRVH